MCMCVTRAYRGLSSGSGVCVALLAVARLAVVALLLCGIAVPSWEVDCVVV
jgi:hypothetical protein